jgi:DNA-binding NarL/FixJ family response regulator
MHEGERLGWPMHALRKDSPARVVVVDDHDVTRVGLCAILAADRHLAVVGQAANGSEALDVCRRVHPHLVLTDVRMPDMDGLALTRAVKRESPTTSVILFTMYENADYLVEALRAGAAGYLLKGAPRDEILTTIHQVLAGESVLQAGTVMQLLHRMSASGGSEQAERTQLTRRERDVLRLIALGQTNREIGDTLTLTISTVKTHVEHVIGKLGVSDRTQAAVRAIELGLVGGVEDASST